MNEVKAEKLMNGLINKLLLSIECPDVCQSIRDGYVAGGAIPSLLLGDYYNDLDIYLSSKSDVDIVLAYFTKEYLSINRSDPDAVKQYQDDNHFHVKLITDNAINLNGKIQIITKWYGDYRKIVEYFDFEHLKGVYMIKDKKIIIPSGVYPLLLNKELVYTGSMFPLSSIIRMRKFLRRGWNISTKDIITMVLECHMYLSYGYTTANAQKKYRSKDLHTGIGDHDLNTLYRNHTYPPIDVTEFVRQLNGVDPLTIQVELEKHLGSTLNISDIIKLL